MIRRFLLALLLLLTQPVFANWDDFWQTKWSGAVYYGKFTKDTLGQVVGFNFELDEDKLYSVEVTRYFRIDGAMRQYWGPMVDEIGITLNFTLHDDRFGTIYEIIPYITAKWPLLPENDLIKARIIIGEGISWVSNVPYREHRNSDEPQKLLNYLMFEISLAPAKHPEFELVYRIHHRSGVFGLYGADNSGSTAVGLTLRYYIDRTPQHFKCPPKHTFHIIKPAKKTKTKSKPKQSGLVNYSFKKIIDKKFPEMKNNMLISLSQ